MAIPIKNANEIEKMRRACRIASQVLERASALIEPGVTTGEVDRAAASFMREANVRSAFLNYRGFPGNICISVNNEVVHGIGGTRRIQYGDIVKLDIGVVDNGWVGDTATTVPVGVIDPAVQRLNDSVTTRGKIAGNLLRAVLRHMRPSTRRTGSVRTDDGGAGRGGDDDCLPGR